MKSANPSVSEVFEIRLDRKTWRKITIIAERENLSFSWITRLCLFHLLRNISPKKSVRFPGPPNTENCHRHMLCLYGEDSLLIRMMAHRWGFSISGLVRLALEMYLEEVEDLDEEEKLFEGIKICKKSQVFQSARWSGMENHISAVHWEYFSPDEYWPIRPRRPRLA